MTYHKYGYRHMPLRKKEDKLWHILECDGRTKRRDSIIKTNIEF